MLLLNSKFPQGGAALPSTASSLLRLLDVFWVELNYGPFLSKLQRYDRARGYVVLVQCKMYFLHDRARGYVVLVQCKMYFLHYRALGYVVLVQVKMYFLHDRAREYVVLVQ